MTAPKPAPTMANVFDDDGRYLGCVFARGVAGFEALDFNDLLLLHAPRVEEVAP